jgi:hypothetical protein
MDAHRRFASTRPPLVRIGITSSPYAGSTDFSLLSQLLRPQPLRLMESDRHDLVAEEFVVHCFNRRLRYITKDPTPTAPHEKTFDLFTRVSTQEKDEGIDGPSSGF